MLETIIIKIKKKLEKKLKKLNANYFCNKSKGWGWKNNNCN